MQHAEKNLKHTIVENTTEEPISRRNRSKTVAMTETELLAGNFHDMRLFKAFHAKLFKIAICPDIVISWKEINLHSPIHQGRKCSKHTDISLWDHITVLIPEVPDVTKKI